MTNTVFSDEYFESEVDRVRTYLRNEERYDMDKMPRPFILEFTGSPSSGKTTVILELDKLFRRYGLRVYCHAEGAEVVRHIPRSTPVYNVRTAMHALEKLIDCSFGHTYDLVIFDRCVFDAYFWMIYHHTKGQLSSKEMKIMQSFFLSPLWTNNLDAVYFLICDAKEAVRREDALSLTDRPSVFSNFETISMVVDRYKDVFRALSKQHKQLRLIDTSDLSELGAVRTITEDVLKIFKERIEASEQ